MPALRTATVITDAMTRAFPEWETGTSVLRDAAGEICGGMVFRRDGGGIVIEFCAWPCGEVLAGDAGCEVDYAAPAPGPDDTAL